MAGHAARSNGRVLGMEKSSAPYGEASVAATAFSSGHPCCCGRDVVARFGHRAARVALRNVGAVVTVGAWGARNGRVIHRHRGIETRLRFMASVAPRTRSARDMDTSGHGQSRAAGDMASRISASAGTYGIGR
jgi:hypothetical protein